jgi:FkbM family methyltransferase
MAHKSRGQARSALVRADKLRTEGRLDEAERMLRELLKSSPRQEGAWLSLAKLLATRGDFPAAERAYNELLAIDPGAFDARVNLGLLLSQRGALPEALAEYEQALKTKPDHALALRNYGGLLRGSGALDQAVQVLTRALALSPDDAAAHTNLGLALSAQGEQRRALVHLERAVALAPREALYHDNLLMLMHYASDLGREAIFAAHQRYGVMASELYPRLPSRPLGPAQHRLRLGYVSADFRRHSVAFFLEPLLAAHDRTRFELFAYNNAHKSDEVTVRLKQSFDHFREVATLSDAALAALIQRDQIDVLVDLSGHTHGNRLSVFARKPAPLQVTYLGYPDTTGLSAIDYRITDAWADPEPSADAFHSERLLRLPSGFLRYQPPRESPEPVPPPSAEGRPPTFGSFNALAKISDQTLSMWRTLLSEAPEARLLIKQGFLSHDASRKSFEQRLSAHGIDLARVVLRGHAPDLRAHLAAYGEVDVALDTFPYHGTTTTCDALFMGVPVISLVSETHVSRVGLSLLSRIGLGELAADTPAGYVQKARDLLRDEVRRKELRGALRSRLAASGVTEGDQVTRAFEHALREAFAALPRSAASELEAPQLPALSALPLPDPEARWHTLDSGVRIAMPRGHDQITGYALEEQGDWFEDEIHFVRKLLSAGESVLDVGANHGVYALAMAHAVGALGQVVAVEPSARVSGRLLASADANAFSQLSVVACAVSDRAGEAVLASGASSELNALAQGVGPSARGERVRLATIDQLVSEQGLRQVSFVKLDVEGEELKALAGASTLMRECAPLWMVEQKHGDRENVGLAESLMASGHQLYRLVPGLDLLFPHPRGTDSDPFLLNVFAATEARAQELERRGLLARMREEPVLPSDASYQEALAATPLAGRSDLARGFAQETPGKLKHKQALALYALAQRTTLGPSARALSLRRALEVALSAIEDPHDLSRLMTLSRLAWAWGRRSIAIEALSTALAAVNQGKARIDEPFLPPCPRYDRIDPGARLPDWAVSALLEQIERLRAFSGFFDKNPKDAIGRLQLLSRLGFQSPEMARRLVLAQARGNA